MNPDDTPAKGVEVVVDPGQVRGFTAANGMARLTINPVEGRQPLTIRVCLCFIFIQTFALQQLLADESFYVKIKHNIKNEVQLLETIQ